MEGMPSSMMPLQLLSMPSQVSGSGLLLQTLKPPPGAQVPGGTIGFGEQISCPTQLGGEGWPQGIGWMPLSGVPSQSLSQPSQISGDELQPMGQPISSMRPLQLSSTPLQTSG